MKRHTTILSVMLAAAMVFTACRKDDDNLVTLNVNLSDYTGSNTKMYVDASRYTHWTSGDQVNINGTGNTCSVDLSGDKAKITGVPNSTGGYLAVYPAGIAGTYGTYSTSISVTLPSTQTYTVDGSGNQIVKAPMYAYCANGETTLTFHNLCSLLKVTINNNRSEDITMQSITVTSSSRKLSGAGRINDIKTDAPSLSMESSSTSFNYVTLDFTSADETVSQGTSKSYYVVVPSFASTNISITVEATSTGLMDLTLTHNSAVMDANMIATGPTIAMNSAVIDFAGMGTESNPFQINNLTDLNTLKTRVNAGKLYDGKYFKLMNDINCGTWAGIGSTTYKFKGSFDGNNNTITYTQSNGGSYTGFFKTAGTATFKNLNVNCAITVSGGYAYYIGGIVGQAEGTTFQYCNVTGSITGASKRYGGITGTIQTTAGTISHCTSSVTISSTVSGEAMLGGIVGDVNKSGSLVEYCTASGDITAANGTKIGGISGSTSSGCTIDNCTYTGTASGSSLTGPIVGSKGGSVTNCTPSDQND